VIILDTNVLSELMKIEPAMEVYAWAGRWDADDLFTTAVSQAEVLAGIATMPDGRKKEMRAQAAELIFGRQFQGRLLPFDTEAAQPYADIVAGRRRVGKPIKEFDAQIAAIAACHGMAVATRDTSGFENCGIQVVNPWTA
jgi:predicted nucleic acid-binding protein